MNLFAKIQKEYQKQISYQLTRHTCPLKRVQYWQPDRSFPNKTPILNKHFLSEFEGYSSKKKRNLFKLARCIRTIYKIPDITQEMRLQMKSLLGFYMSWHLTMNSSKPSDRAIIIRRKSIGTLAVWWWNSRPV